MISEHVVIVALIVEAGALAAAVALLLAHGVGLWLRTALLSRRVAASRAALVAAVGAVDAVGDLPPRPRLPLREQLEILGALRPSIAGGGRERIAALAADSGLELRGERLCASRLWRRRLRGVRLLTLLGGGEQAVPALLEDRHPSIRAQAVEWASDHPDSAVVERLVGLVGRPDVVPPFKVRDALLRIGRPAVEPLVARLEHAEGAAAREPLRLADGLADPTMLAATLRLSRDPDTGARAAAARLLGAVGGADAAAAVAGMLADQEAEVRAAAAQALGRGGHRSAAPALTELLRDPAWAVRRAAALSLRSFGGAGVLLLRRALNDPHQEAREMARQTLELPEAAVR